MEEVFIIYYNLPRSANSLIKELGYKSFELRDVPKEGKLVLIGSPFYKYEHVLYVEHFVKEYSKRLIGVVIQDDMSYGKKFGDIVPFYKNLNVPIVAVLDSVFSERDVIKLKEEIEK